MCSELPKEFEKTSEVLPLTAYGLATVDNFRRAEETLQRLEWLKKAGLSNDEVKLYQDNEDGHLDNRTMIESSVLKAKLDVIYNKINTFKKEPGCSKPWKDIKEDKQEKIIDKIQNKPLAFYPEGHPMNELRELEESLFGHLRDDTLPLTKRRKIMRRLERKRERILAQENQVSFEDNAVLAAQNRPGSLWDVKEVVGRPSPELPVLERGNSQNSCMIGPRNPTMYTIRDNRIVRLEPVDREREEYRAVDIVMPVNQAEEELLEGTKMPLEDIMKIDRFKDYEPGIPSKVLYLKNISPSVSQEQLSLLFNQFVLENGGPIDVRLMSGRMRGQAFVAFQNENLAIQALDEVNGTILSGQPIIAQFGRNSNRIQIDENR